MYKVSQEEDGRGYEGISRNELQRKRRERNKKVGREEGEVLRILGENMPWTVRMVIYERINKVIIYSYIRQAKTLRHIANDRNGIGFELSRAHEPEIKRRIRWGMGNIEGWNR